MATTTPPRRAVTVYEPTVTGLPPMRAYLRGLWDRRVFMWHMARTDMKAQHYDTVGGVVWLIARPPAHGRHLLPHPAVFGAGGPPSQTGPT